MKSIYQQPQKGFFATVVAFVLASTVSGNGSLAADVSDELLASHIQTVNALHDVRGVLATWNSIDGGSLAVRASQGFERMGHHPGEAGGLGPVPPDRRRGHDHERGR